MSLVAICFRLPLSVMEKIVRSMESSSETIGASPERDILRRIFPRLPESRYATLGPGDDAAIISAPDGRYVVTSDMMVHGPDFRLAWSSPEDLGWKAAATNLADVAAMGALPTALVVALALPRDLTLAVVEGIADGFRLACDALAPGCGVVGGDLSTSSVLTIAVSAFGDLGGRSPVLRSNARPGDTLALAGRMGEAARGIRLLFSEAVDPVSGEPDRARMEALCRSHADVIDAQLRPQPPITAGPRAARAGATAMLDVSDGLALDARRLADASGVSLWLDSARLGPDPHISLVGGEDHSLLATFPPDSHLPEEFIPLGQVREGTGIWVDGEAFDEHGGWEPFIEWDGNAG